MRWLYPINGYFHILCSIHEMDISCPWIYCCYRYKYPWDAHNLSMDISISSAIYTQDGYIHQWICLYPMQYTWNDYILFMDILLPQIQVSMGSIYRLWIITMCGYINTCGYNHHQYILFGLILYMVDTSKLQLVNVTGMGNLVGFGHG